MKELDDYFLAKEKIYKYFGYISNREEIPLNDGRNYYWMLVNDVIVYNNEPFTPENLGENGGKFYSSEIYNSRYLNKYIYKTDDYTMVAIDTKTYNNEFLIILNNKLECKDESLKDIYKKYW